jgi:peptide chain release factor subunit 1
MITREDIRELARFQYNDADRCVLSFYFQPRSPENKSHRGETILAKDLVREALHETEHNAKNKCARADLQRILELAGHLHGNQAKAKAVFACGKRNFWREYELPPQLAATQLFVNRRFHLKPLAMLLGAQPQIWIALVDRHRARFFDLRLDELHEHNSMFHPLPRRGRSDGFAGYDAGHAERGVKDEVMHHFKDVAERLKQAHDQGRYEKLIIGCQDTSWHDFEPHLHPYVKNRLLGRFSADVGSITDDDVREHAKRILQEALDQRRYSLVREVLGQAKSNGRGVTGLRRVLRALEVGEAQTLLIAENYSARAVECIGCSHLDSHMVRYCPICGRGTRELEDVCDGIIPAAIRRDVELLYVRDEPEFDRVGNIAALLRFRSGQNRGTAIA